MSRFFVINPATLECGTAWVNAHMLVEHRAPFGGWKRSGTGRRP